MNAQDVKLGVWTDHPIYSDFVEMDGIALTLGGQISILSDSIIAPVPIPGAILLLGSGLFGLVAFRRRLNKY